MKNKLLKSIKLIAVIILTGIMFINNYNVNAAAKTIKVGEGTYISPLIGTIGFHTKVTTSGQYIYCVNRWKNTVENTTGTLVGEMDAGFAYLVENGFPNKSFTGNKQRDYYITQAAMWWYTDEVNGNNDSLTKEFKTTATDKYNLRPYIKKLVEGAVKARKDGYAKTSLSINLSDSKMSLASDGKYFVSEKIKVTSSNIKEYTVSVANAPEGTLITTPEGVSKTKFSANEQFIIKVPAAKVTDTKLSINFSVEATGSVKKAYEYKPADSKMQNFITTELVSETKKVTDKLSLTISTSKVTIVKLDKATNKTLAGAELVLKDSTGKELDSWTSTTNAHTIQNLSNGTYTIEEKNAPKGYKKLTEPITFKVTDANKNVQVKVYNEARESVVTITKIDKSTEQPLAGAVLVVRKQDGTEVARFTTTTDSYSLLNLENGTYTIEEVSAPAGYKKSDDKITFTIDDNNLTHQITFENYPEVPVPDTASTSSIITTLLGIIMICSAVGFVYKNAKKAK